MKTKDYVIIALIIIGFCILYLKPNDTALKIEQKNYDKKLDSIMDKVAKSEAKQYKTIQNVTNNIIENNSKKFWYSQSDSLRLHYIDSTFRVEGL